MAQDVILKTSGDEINAKVIEITLHDILYKNPNSVSDSLYSVPKSEVFMVKYANGTKELMTSTPTEPGNPSERPPNELEALGRQDAKRYYRGNNAVWGSAGATLLLGLTGTIIVAAVPPKIQPSEVSDIRLLNNIYYAQGYRAQAHKKKVGKAALGGGIAIGSAVLLLMTVVASHR